MTSNILVPNVASVFCFVTYCNISGLYWSSVKGWTATLCCLLLTPYSKYLWLPSLLEAVSFICNFHVPKAELPFAVNVNC